MPSSTSSSRPPGRSFQPRPYQRTAVQQVLDLHRKGRLELLLHLPTGSGKTVIAALLLETLLPRLGAQSKVLFIAHRKELLDQTAATLAQQMPDVQVSIEQGKRTASLDAQIIIASIQSLVRRKDAYPADQFSVIICDECHRALAPSWQDVINHFHDRRTGSTLLLGMTATPRRTDGRSAGALFDTVAYAISKPELQDLGYLVPVQYWSVRTDLHLDRVKMSGGDFQVASLSAIMNTDTVRGLALRAWQEKARGKKTLGFCASVAHAHQMAEDFTVAGYRAAVIDGRTRNRDEILETFRAGGLDVLFNYGVLTEGFDDPAIECLLMTRPTTSPLVYDQCMGRGLRPHPGKRFCTVIDIVDRTTHQLQYGASELAGLPRGWTSRGRDPFRESRAVRGVRVSDPDAFAAVRAARSLEEIQDLLVTLPAEVVVAGLDGEPVPHYEVAGLDASDDQPLTARQIRIRLGRLLRQAGATVKKIELLDADEEFEAPTAGRLSEHRAEHRAVHQAAHRARRACVHLTMPEVNNERFHYLLWHLARTAGCAVTFAEPTRKQASKRSPRALLRSMLPEDHRIVKFMPADDRDEIIAEISGIQGDSLAGLRADFERETGLALQLRGQLAFDF